MKKEKEKAKQLALYVDEMGDIYNQPLGKKNSWTGHTIATTNAKETDMATTDSMSEISVLKEEVNAARVLLATALATLH